MSEIPIANIAPLKLPYARVAMLCQFRTCSGLCGNRVLASKSKPLCFKHFTRKSILNKCTVADCENGTASNTGRCVHHDQNAENMRLKRSSDRNNFILHPPRKPVHCDICNIDMVNITMHNKTKKHNKALLLYNLQCDTHGDKDDGIKFSKLMDEVKEYYFKTLRKNR